MSDGRGKMYDGTYGSGFMVKGSGFMVKGSGFMVKGYGFMVSGCRKEFNCLIA